VPVTVTLFNTSDVVLRVGIDTGVSHNRFYLIVVIVTRLAVVFRHVSFWTLHWRNNRWTLVTVLNNSSVAKINTFGIDKTSHYSQKPLHRFYLFSQYNITSHVIFSKHLPFLEYTVIFHVILSKKGNLKGFPEVNTALPLHVTLLIFNFY